MYGIYFPEQILHGLDEVVHDYSLIKYLKLDGVENLNTNQIIHFENTEQIWISNATMLTELDLRPFKKLKQLLISSSTQIDFQQIGLNELIELNYLMIWGCNLEGCLDLSNLSNLKELDIKKTSLSEVILSPKSKSLKSINIANNKLQKVPTNLSSCSSLVFLSLTGNEITELPNWNEVFPAMKTLYLGMNQLSKIENQLKSFPNLENLSLALNKINHIDFIPLFTKKLSLMRNSLSYFPTCISNLKELIELNIDSNNIEALDLNGLEKLEVLEVGNCKLKELPKNLEKLDNLSELDLSENLIGPILEKGLHLCNPKLSILNLSRNKCNTLNKCNIFIESTFLSRLEITACDLLSMNIKTDSKDITEINACCNDFEEIPECFFNFDRLLCLNLSGNKIKEVNNKIVNLKNLKVLNLQWNQLTEISSLFCELPNLEELDLVDNEIKNLNINYIRFGINFLLLKLYGNPLELEAIDLESLTYNIDFKNY